MGIFRFCTKFYGQSIYERQIEIVYVVDCSANIYFLGLVETWAHETSLQVLVFVVSVV